MNLLRQLWNDERGFVSSTELILISTIAVIGLIVGLAVYRDSIVQELGDAGAAVGQLNQSYSLSVAANNADPAVTAAIAVNTTTNVVTVTRDFGDVDIVSTFKNFDYDDTHDLYEPDPASPDDPASDAPAGILLNLVPINEGDLLP